MKAALLFDFVVDKANKTILVKREFAAERALVWDAYTKSELLDQWWAPKPWKSKTKKMDFREGGEWHYAMVGPEGEEHWALAKYQRINPKTTFTVKDSFADADGNVNKELPESTWNIVFSDQGDHTLVENRLSYDSLEQLEAVIQMGFKEGLTMAMENLDRLLASIK
ncbi:MAG TPA: ATPase [Bacteroidetes bacterium]|nr:ATPase [Bacteroidota bacterium]